MENPALIDEEEERYVVTQIGEVEIATAKPIAEWPLDEVWAQYEEIGGIIRNLYRDKDVLEAELGRRLSVEHPDYSAEAGGSVDLAGQELILHVTMDRTYAYRDDGIMELQRLAAERPDVLTPAEFETLVPEWTPKVSGTAFNKLVKRGGLLADMLNSIRFLQRSKPKYEKKARL